MTVLKSSKVLMRVLCVFVMLWQALFHQVDNYKTTDEFGPCKI